MYTPNQNSSNKRTSCQLYDGYNSPSNKKQRIQSEPERKKELTQLFSKINLKFEKVNTKNLMKNWPGLLETFIQNPNKVLSMFYNHLQRKSKDLLPKFQDFANELASEWGKLLDNTIRGEVCEEHISGTYNSLSKLTLNSRLRSLIVKLANSPR